GPDGDLDHVGVLFAHALVDLLQLGRHVAHVVVADDALDVLVARDGVGDVGLQVDPVEAGHDGLAQEHAAGVLGPGPAAAVLRAAHRGDQGARLVGQEALEVGGALEQVQAQLDQPRPLFCRLPDLDLDHRVPRPADHDTNGVQLRQRHARPPGHSSFVTGKTPAGFHYG